MIALTDGELAWDNAVGDFAAREDMPLPPVLTGRFATEPKWVDLRAYREGADPRDGRFIEAGADFAAAIHGMPKEDLLSQEVRQQRRALRLAWGAAASLLILAGLAGWQAKVALDNERLRSNSATSLTTAQARAGAARPRRADVGSGNQDREFAGVRLGARVSRPRRHAGRSGAPDSGAGAGAAAAASESGESTPELRRSEAAALIDLVDTLLAVGDTKAALAAAERARSISEDLTASDPGNAQWQRDVSVALNKIGDVRLATGDRTGARAAYEEGLAIMRKLAASDPEQSRLADRPEHKPRQGRRRAR